MSTPIREFDAWAVRASAQTAWVFLRAVDAAGVAGWGEATLNGSEAGLAAAFTRIAARMRGVAAEPRQDPLGAAGVAPGDRPGAAIASALDQALWDIAARRAGRSLHTLFGGDAGVSVPLYANVNRRTADRRPEGFAASALKAVADGYDTIKIAPFDEVRPGRSDGIEQGVARAAAVREAIGAGRRLFVDCHWRFDEANAGIALDRLAALGIDWFECPVAETPANYPALRRLRERANALGAKLAGCETETGLDGFRPYVDRGLYDVLMPDVKYAGGFAEFRRTAAYAAANGIRIAPHNPSGPIAHVASLQVCAGLPGFMTLEHQYDESPMFTEIVLGSLPRTVGGLSALPGGPGLGIALDVDKLTPLARFVATMSGAAS